MILQKQNKKISVEPTGKEFVLVSEKEKYKIKNSPDTLKRLIRLFNRGWEEKGD